MYGSALASPVVSSTTLGMMTYIGTDDGYVLAFKVGSAQLVWSRPLGGDVIASPVVSDGALWMATQNPPKLYKFNLTTGAIECSLVTPKQFFSSFTAATPPGGKPSIYVSNLDDGVTSGPIMGIAASNCTVEWSFSKYLSITGPWSPIAYGVDEKGTPLVLDGSSSTDDTEYAVNALTGKEVWHFQAPTNGDYDIGAGATISPPGVNGFADGVAYVPSKFGDHLCPQSDHRCQTLELYVQSAPAHHHQRRRTVNGGAGRDESGVRAPRRRRRSQRRHRSCPVEVQRPNEHRGPFVGGHRREDQGCRTLR